MIDVPAPRWPAAADARMPDPEVLDELAAGAGDPVREALAARATARAALDDLVAARPAGEAWQRARAADQQTVLDGKAAPKVWAVEALAAGEAARWSRASAEATTISSRVAVASAQVAAVPGLRDTIVSEVDELQAAAAKASAMALAAARADDRAKCYPLLRDVDLVLARVAVLQAIRRWLDGDGFEIEKARVPKAVVDFLTDAREQLAGLPDDERRIAREIRCEQRREFDRAIGYVPAAVV